MENIVFSLILSQLILLPIARKWELNLRPVIIVGLLVGLLVGIFIDILSISFTMSLFARLLFSITLILLTSLALLLIWFFRDPERIPPEKKNIIVAPADGTIKYIKRIEVGNIPLSSKGKEHVKLDPVSMDILPDQKGYLIGIGMSFLDVHVTRSPIEGKLAYFKHVNGRFYSLKKPDASYKNERAIQIIKNDNFGICLIHIASRLVRRIVSYVKEGDHLILGQKIGMIKFGSQVDILLPDIEYLRINTKVGEKVFAGVTIIATYSPEHSCTKTVKEEELL